MIVFLHGVPETTAIWDGIRERIDRDSVALPLPGFGNPRPAGFGATKDDYIDWLLGELDGIDEPIDLVGHDWGALLTYRIATAHGDRLRSWAADVANVVHADYVWHAFARLWQTPGDGEASIEAQGAMPVEDLAAGFEGLGVPHDGAVEMATASGADMGSCILDLYRSAAPNLHGHWSPWVATVAPGLVLHATEDPFGHEAMTREMAAVFGATVAPLDGVGHFWPYQAPEASAAVLTAFWDGL